MIDTEKKRLEDIAMNSLRLAAAFRNRAVAAEEALGMIRGKLTEELDGRVAYFQYRAENNAAWADAYKNRAAAAEETLQKIQEVFSLYDDDKDSDRQRTKAPEMHNPEHDGMAQEVQETYALSSVAYTAQLDKFKQANQENP